jgi:hypothetical protein
MKCPVCFAAWPNDKGALCPQCQWNTGAPNAQDLQTILKAREAFKSKVTAYDPDSRVTRWDVIQPWIGVLIGFVLFCLWLRACATGGKMFF